MEDKKKVQMVEKTASELLNLMKFDFVPEVELIEDSQGKSYVKLSINSDDVALLIGRGGETLKSIQTILSLIVSREDPDVRVILDINDYQKKKEESLTRMLDYKIQQMRDHNETEIDLFPMEPNQRRVVHEYIATLPGLTSHSEGEGADRRVVITVE
ncbi:KH domain-containing protein [Candidatus Dojkabacteria bacterium]|uniref:KH domain-containing protein n=1 Tax=Candidatus Dojkabacteria bacterium TaxID=2099670 RepID=A0A955L386_9BACT|nr:KH domain-containing protein [Candidatus Dojkabacteria bacterium]